MCRSNPSSRSNPPSTNPRLTNIKHPTDNETALVYYANVDNSLLCKYDLLLAQIQAEEPLIIALCEIKPKNGKIPDVKLLEIPGYTLHLSNIEGQDTRGVCVYVSNKCKSIQLHKNKNYNDAVWVNISGDKSKERFSSAAYTGAELQLLLQNMMKNLIKC